MTRSKASGGVGLDLEFYDHFVRSYILSSLRYILKQKRVGSLTFSMREAIVHIPKGKDPVELYAYRPHYSGC